MSLDYLESMQISYIRGIDFNPDLSRVAKNEYGTQ